MALRTRPDKQFAYEPSLSRVDPEPFNGKQVLSVGCGGDHNVVLLEGEEKSLAEGAYLFSFGLNGHGQLMAARNLGLSNPNSQPVPIDPANFKQVCMAYQHAVCLRAHVCPCRRLVYNLVCVSFGVYVRTRIPTCTRTHEH